MPGCLPQDLRVVVAVLDVLRTLYSQVWRENMLSFDGQLLGAGHVIGQAGVSGHNGDILDSVFAFSD